MAADVRAGCTVARIDEWVAKSQPGARRIYGIGLSAGEAAGEGVAARVRALADCGLVQLFAVRAEPAGGAHPFDFLIVRTRREVPPAFPALPVRAFKPGKVTVIKLSVKKS
jgi:hypothetical protein